MMTNEADMLSRADELAAEMMEEETNNSKTLAKLLQEVLRDDAARQDFSRILANFYHRSNLVYAAGRMGEPMEQDVMWADEARALNLYMCRCLSTHLVPVFKQRALEKVKQEPDFEP